MSRLEIRLTPSEKEQIKKLANRLGLTYTDTIKKLVAKRSQEKPLLSKAERKLLQEGFHQLRKLGINLNQAIRKELPLNQYAYQELTKQIVKTNQVFSRIING